MTKYILWNLFFLMLGCGWVQAQEKSFDEAVLSEIANYTPSEIANYINSGNDVNLKDHNGNSLLHYAVNQSEYPEVVEALIRSGADVNAANADGYSCLMLIAKYNNNFEFNLDAAKNTPEFKDIDFEKLIEVNNEKNLQIANSLLEGGADINVSNTDGTTALMYASTSPHNVDLITLLIDYGALLDQANDKGETALIYAMKYSKEPTEIIKMLTYHGINLKRLDKDDKTAYDYALEKGSLDADTLELIRPKYEEDGF